MAVGVRACREIQAFSQAQGLQYVAVSLLVLMDMWIQKWSINLINSKLLIFIEIFYALLIQNLKKNQPNKIVIKIEGQ